MNYDFRNHYFILLIKRKNIRLWITARLLISLLICAFASTMVRKLLGNYIDFGEHYKLFCLSRCEKKSKGSSCCRPRELVSFVYSKELESLPATWYVKGATSSFVYFEKMDKLFKIVISNPFQSSPSL